MRKYLYRAAMALFLVSMLLPVADVTTEGYRPGILLGIFGISTARYLFANPFAFICWAANITFLIAFLRAKKNLLQGRIFAVATVLMSLSIWLEPVSDWTVLGGLAYQAWTGAFLLLVGALFVKDGEWRRVSGVGA